MTVERILDKNDVVAIIVRKELQGEGPQFFSPEDYPFQLGIIRHKKGTAIRPHRHRNIERAITIAQEMLHIDEGKVEIDIYGDGKEVLETVTLVGGDTILLAKGGHGLRYLEDTKIVEVKQGPFFGVENEKEYL